MTPQEADVLRFLEARGGMASDTAISRQFGMDGGGRGIVLRTMLRHLWIEQGRRYVRVTTIGETALSDHDDHWKYAPFEGRPSW